MIHLVAFYRAKSCFQFFSIDEDLLTTKDAKGNNFMHFALLSGWNEVVTNEPYADYIEAVRFPAHSAAYSGDLICFKYVYAMYESDNSFLLLRNEENLNIIQICIYYNSLEILEFVRSNNIADLYDIDNLHYSILANNTLLFKDIFLNIKNNNSLSTSLPILDVECAIKHDNALITKTLIEQESYSKEQLDNLMSISIQMHSNSCALYLEYLIEVGTPHMLLSLVYKNDFLIHHFLESYQFPTFVDEVTDLTVIFMSSESKEKDIIFPDIIKPLVGKLNHFVLSLLKNEVIEESNFILFTSFLSTIIQMDNMIKRNRIIIKVTEYLLGLTSIYDVLSIVTQYEAKLEIIKFVLELRSTIRNMKLEKHKNTSIWSNQDTLNFWLGFLTFSNNTRLLSAIVNTKSINQCVIYLKEIYSLYSSNWSIEEETLLKYLKDHGATWREISLRIQSKSNQQCKKRYRSIKNSLDTHLSDPYVDPFSQREDLQQEEIFPVEKDHEDSNQIELIHEEEMKGNDGLNEDGSSQEFKAKSNTLNLKKEIKELKKQNCYYHIANSRLKLQNDKLKEELSYHKQFNLLANDSSISSHILQELVSNSARNKYHRIYDEKIMDFSYIVHSISPASYRFIRTFLPLPTPRTIEVKFNIIKSEYTEALQHIEMIPTLINTLKKRYKGGEMDHFDATISIDAFSIEVFKKSNHDAFIFDCLPLSGLINTFPLHFEFTNHGQATNDIDTLLIKIQEVLEQCSVYPRYLATDGDAYWQYRHDNVFKEIVKLYKTGEIASIIEYVRSIKLFPITDFLHFIKNMRNKIMNHTMSLSNRNLDHLITGEILNAVIHVGAPLEDRKYSSKMIDRYPLAIFTLSNLIKCIDAEEYDCFIYLLPCTMWNIAMTGTHLTDSTRGTLFSLAFHTFMLYQHMTADKCWTEMKYIYSSDSCATFIMRSCDIARAANSTIGQQSVLGLPIELTSLNRISSHPTENHIGVIRVGSFFFHSAENLLRSSVKGSLNHICQKRLDIDPIINKRTNMAGQKLNKSKDIINVELCISSKEIIKGAFQKANIMPIDNEEDTNTCYNTLCTFIRKLSSLLDSSKKIKTSKEQPHSMCSVSNIIARLVQGEKKKLKEKSKEITNGEMKLIMHLRIKGLTLDSIVKYIPGKDIAMIKKAIEQPENAGLKHVFNNKRVLVGLPNQGNTCYVASVLQIFLNHETLFLFICSIKAKDETLLKELQLFIGSIQQSESTIVDDIQTLLKHIDYYIFSIMPLNHQSQNDAAEFMLHLINHIGYEMDQKDQKAFFNLIQGSMINLVKCSAKHENCIISKFIILTFNFKYPEQITIDVDELMNSVEDKETFANSKCSTCNITGDIVKQTFIESLPSILIIQFTRFDQNQRKCLTSVSFNNSLMLGIADKLGHTELYLLKSAIIHIGETISTGHYITFTFNSENANIFDDGDITAVETYKIINDKEFQSNIYLLVYDKIICE